MTHIHDPAHPGRTLIETHSGTYVDVLNPDPDTILLSDIAWALAHTSRFGGHTRRPYTVCEHVLLVADHMACRDLPDNYILAGLHHDDAEAYLGDVVTPLKALLPGYHRITQRMDTTIALATGVPIGSRCDPAVAAEVKVSDAWALQFEARQLLPSGGRGWAGEHQVVGDFGIEYELGFENPRDIAAQFIDYHHRLRRRQEMAA